MPGDGGDASDGSPVHTRVRPPQEKKEGKTQPEAREITVFAPVLEFVLGVWLLACSAATVLCQTGHEAHSQVLYLQWLNPCCVTVEGYNLPAVFWVVYLLPSSVHTNGNLTSV